MCVGSSQEYKEFVQYPADWLGPDQQFNARKVSISDSNHHQYAPPMQESNGVAWYNVLTFGVNNRVTQLAFYGFHIYNADAIYIRRQHDNNVSEWKKLITEMDFEPFVISIALDSNYCEAGSFVRMTKCINIVNLTFWIKFTSNLPSTTYQRITISSQTLPKAFKNEQCSNSLCIDGEYSDGYLSVDIYGNLILNPRSKPLTSKIIVGGFNYIAEQ